MSSRAPVTRFRQAPHRRLSILAALLGIPAICGAGDIYRYRDDSGRWVFSDRVPESGRDYRLEIMPGAGAAGAPAVMVRRESADGRQRLLARNDCYCSVEVTVVLTGAVNAAGIVADQAKLVVPARESRELIQVAPLRQDAPWSFDYEYGFVLGDPSARHRPGSPYRLPFAAGQAYLVTQAAPDRATHDTPDSQYAVDFAMPEGTGVYASRAGIVVEVAYGNFRAGLDREAFGARANLVRILHDDGTFAVYAHLRRDSVRVRVGQQVRRGELIGASGNTGYSTGPHLHFAVTRNAGLRTVSIPVLFDDGTGRGAAPLTGQRLANP
jgi:hypothetical protein